MSGISEYTHPLSYTGQFSFCGLPFRLDTYLGCGFNCCYCFAKLRGGVSNNKKKLSVASAEKIIQAFESAIKKPEIATGVVSEAIRSKMPVHFGGMSDPFQPAEQTYGISYQVLKYLCSIQYPVVLSTKSTLVASKTYLKLLESNPNIIVQFSFSSSIDKLAALTEPSSTKPSRLLVAMYNLSQRGINVSVRWQPYIPGVSEEVSVFMRNVSSTGAFHVGFEHLKLPLEKNSLLWQRLLKNLNFNILEYYKDAGAVKDGREIVLPAKYKISKSCEVKVKCQSLGISFGAADNEIQYLSTSDCCCSGADQIPGFENWNRYQIAHAVKKSNYEDFGLSIIDSYERPIGSIDQFLNSRTRIDKQTKSHNTVEDYIRERWNNLDSIFNPTRFHGVLYNGEKDENGDKKYTWGIEESCS